MKSLCVAFLTARQHPCIEWFLDSLRRQVGKNPPPEIIIVDFNCGKTSLPATTLPVNLRHVPVKPNVWQGDHRLTKGHWWAKSAAINTAACLCKTEWLAFVDDRSVLMPGWLDAIRRAMKDKYAVAGAYEKRTAMSVDDGIITSAGNLIGTDPRQKGGKHYPSVASWYGCTNALPLEWLLEINGADECCDSLGMEDVVMGSMLHANKFEVRYDPRMKIVEDRSPQFYEALCARTDKGPSPNDKSHGILKRVAGKKKATHHWDLRAVRDAVQQGEPFPIPDQPTTDWWDNQDLKDFP